MARPQRTGDFDGEIFRYSTTRKGAAVSTRYYRWNGKEWKSIRSNTNDAYKRWKEQQQEIESRGGDTSGIGSAFNRLTINLSNRKNLANVSSEGALRYPRDESIETTSDYVSFSFFKYRPPLKGTSTDGDQFNVSGGTIDISRAYKNYNASIVEIEPADGLPSILLYMPQDVQSEYSQDWGAIKIGTAAATTIRTLSGNADISSIGSNVGDTIKKAAFSAITGLTNKFAGGGTVGRDQALALVTDQIANPNTEVLFNGSNLRTFTLNFKMVADSEDESEEILKICNTFKSASMPSFGGASDLGISAGSGQFLTIPNVVNVSFMSGNSLNKYLPQFKTCAITSVSVNYTADGTYAAYENGAPVAVELSLSFTELKPLFASEIDITGESASF